MKQSVSDERIKEVIGREIDECPEGIQSLKESIQGLIDDDDEYIKMMNDKIDKEYSEDWLKNLPTRLLMNQTRLCSIVIL